jgi:hypothetical protein
MTRQISEVRIRRFEDCNDCLVIVAVGVREIVLKCPDYNYAVRWARLECKSYKIESGFSVEGERAA